MAELLAMISRLAVALSDLAISIVLALLVGGCSSDDLLGEDMALLSSLPPTDRMRVLVVDHGPWGDTAFELEFRRDGQPRVKGVRITGRWSEVSDTLEVQRRSAPAETTLSGGDLHDLDQVLRYYRAGPDESCDETRIVTVTQLRKHKTIATKRFEDRSCGEGLEEVTTFTDIMARLDFPR